MNTMIKDLLETIADITGEVDGAYNLRSNGCGVERRSSENINFGVQEVSGWPLIRKFKVMSKRLTVFTKNLLDCSHERALRYPYKNAPNRISPSHREKPCPPEKMPYIKEAFRHFGMI